ncbi:MAG: DUF3450 family protein [Luteolibacter sp.]|jgi:hypothetical protein|nr:DUF3450 family protein [Luteolibacter sp.]
MRISIPIFALVLALPLSAQETVITPTEELRTSVREWVETMRKIQQEENDWSRDQEVLQNYKEGLAKEITDLQQQIADAKTRKAGADQESLDQSTQRDRYAAAKDELSGVVRKLEENLAAKLPLFPAPLLAEPRVAQGIEDLQRDLKLPTEKRSEGVSKRLLNVINLLTEAEKFQQTVHLRPELRKNADGREFNMQVLYFGLACAYAVNDDGSFAVVGRPAADGWKFEERKELAPEIQKLIAATTGDQDAAFINLPLSKP